MTSAARTLALALILTTFFHSPIPAAQQSPASGRPDQDDQPNVHIRGNLLNSLYAIQEKKQAHVAFLGGSITEMNGYRPIVEKWLSDRFPETQFEFTNAGIASTCSNTGAFRLRRDVLSQGPVDLLLVEFAVNDDQDAHHSADRCVAGMEGIVRHLRHHNPCADIVMVHFVNPEMLELIQAGKEPLSSAEHERVAEHYQVSSVYLSREVARQIKDGKLTWDQFGGTHPGPHGNQLAADMVTQLLSTAWKLDGDRGTTANGLNPSPHEMPSRPVSERSLDAADFLPQSAASSVSGWTLGIPDWNALEGSKRERFTSEQLWTAETQGAELKVQFEGNAVGAYLLAGPDAGMLEFRIDGNAWKSVDLYHQYSGGLHYPRSVIFADGLAQGPHVLELRVSGSSNAQSKGHAARILAFAANAPHGSN